MSDRGVQLTDKRWKVLHLVGSSVILISFAGCATGAVEPGMWMFVCGLGIRACASLGRWWSNE